MTTTMLGVESESSIITHFHRHKALLIPDSDMDEAAQQLLQLSDHEENYYKCNKKKKLDNTGNYLKGTSMDDNEEDSCDQSITSKMIIEEIFGKEEEREEVEVTVAHPAVLRKRKRKFRSLNSIYETTKPLKDSKVRC